MAKRKNPHRRLLAAQAALRRDLQTLGNAADAGKLQEGRVRSVLDTGFSLRKRSLFYVTSARAPNMAPWEGRGKRGKVLRGKFKPVKAGAKARFASK